MDISFENILERDVDFLLMRQFSIPNKKMIALFTDKACIKNVTKIKPVKVSHSVMTADGESDVEVILEINGDRIGFLIEDKIDAVAQPEQASRYKIRAEKSVEKGLYANYHIFIVAPKKYLDGNKEAALYPNRISYEELREALSEEIDISIIDKALDESKKGYIPIEDHKVTDFWNKLYDFVDEKFSNTFIINGKKGESRGSKARWITIKSGKGTSLQIKADRGYVDLEISGYADKFQEFSKNNQDLLDRKKLYLRMASKSLAIRSYFERIDFEKSFEDQTGYLEDAFVKAKELQDLVKQLKY